MKKTLSKPTKGQKLYIVGSNYKKIDGVCTVTSSGPKYFEIHVDGQSDYYKVKFHQDTWGEKTNCSSNYNLYHSEGDFLAEKEHYRLSSFVRSFVMDRDFSKLETEHLKKIEEIMLSVSTEGEKS